MSEMRNMPVWTSKADLCEVLTYIAELVKAGDSFEGGFEYLMPDPDDKPDDVEESDWAQGFMVTAAFRVGNLQGQGGMEMIGEMGEVPDRPKYEITISSDAPFGITHGRSGE